ncbi:MAG TPA: diphthine--ammonia ligase [Thermoplasmata archaeon]|nr:diphthine--ammonia ligase [Thermoplasmata archaeon]
MRLAALFSGGKDSTYALDRVLDEGHEIVRLVTVVSERMDSYMYQVAGIELAGYAARALGLPQTIVPVSGVPEEELLPLRDALSGLDIDGVVSGAIRSEYQRSRIEHICAELGLESLTPLWHTGPERIGEMADRGYEMVVVAVASMGLGTEWIGRRIDRVALDELLRLERVFGINPDGEGGEFETAVLDGPRFRRRVVIRRHRVVWERDSGYMVVEEAGLEAVRAPVS